MSTAIRGVGPGDVHILVLFLAVGICVEPAMCFRGWGSMLGAEGSAIALSGNLFLSDRVEYASLQRPQGQLGLDSRGGGKLWCAGAEMSFFGGSGSGGQAGGMRWVATLRGGTMSLDELAAKHGLNESLVEYLRQGQEESQVDNSTVAERMASWEGKPVSVLLEQGIEMRAKLIMLDDGMNAMLAGPVERYSTETGELLGTDKEDILVKGSNVLHVALMEGATEIEVPIEDKAPGGV